MGPGALVGGGGGVAGKGGGCLGNKCDMEDKRSLKGPGEPVSISWESGVGPGVLVEGGGGRVAGKWGGGLSREQM